MNVYRCEDCRNCIGHTCDIYRKDKDKAIYDCFKEEFKNYESKAERLALNENLTDGRV